MFFSSINYFLVLLSLFLLYLSFFPNFIFLSCRVLLVFDLLILFFTSVCFFSHLIEVFTFDTVELIPYFFFLASLLPISYLLRFLFLSENLYLFLYHFNYTTLSASFSLTFLPLIPSLLCSSPTLSKPDPNRCCSHANYTKHVAFLSTSWFPAGPILTL